LRARNKQLFENKKKQELVSFSPLFIKQSPCRDLIDSRYQERGDVQECQKENQRDCQEDSIQKKV
jgi:hypothetical protein